MPINYDVEYPKLQRKFIDLQAENAELEIYRDIVIESQQTKTVSGPLAEHFAEMSGESMNPDEQELYWAAQNLETQLAQLRAKLERVREAYLAEAAPFDPRVGTPFENSYPELAKAVRAALSESDCNHEYVDPTNEVVDANGYQVCIHCGKLDSEVDK